ncbi:hypothetical protein AAES_49861 [Amazona aestiva]|uniref:Uncharacterized protein n=1 Tax=Amazona aestiva TaxID=12930 RepID=A0A0Q3MP27_AMAAE|nr:hypothetical protein AAES_49861 [Amazona aestiva]
MARGDEQKDTVVYMDYFWKNVRTEERHEESYQRKDNAEEKTGFTEDKQKMRTTNQIFPKEGGEEIAKIGKG